MLVIRNKANLVPITSLVRDSAE